MDLGIEINIRNVFISGNDNVKPREETFYQIFKNLICSRLTLNSFIFVNTIINFIAYILTLIQGIEEINDEV